MQPSVFNFKPKEKAGEATPIVEKYTPCAIETFSKICDTLCYGRRNRGEKEGDMANIFGKNIILLHLK